MAKQISWTYRAQQDRIEILHYWRLRNQSNAYSKKLNILIKKAISLIAIHPDIAAGQQLKAYGLNLSEIT